jgi:ribosome-associated protein
MSDPDDLLPSDLEKSKSQIKREMTELQKLGERLQALSREQLKKANLPAQLAQAIDESKRITSHSAKRRQLQYIGRLMRDLEDPQAVRDFLQKIENKHQKTNAYFHMLESWRERLITEEQSALTDFINLYPAADRQHLRQLVLNAKKERHQGTPKGAAKLLFQYLKELQQSKQEETF